MIKMLFIVGSGGFFGSSARYLTQVMINKYFPSSFPYGTFSINVSGSLLIGIIFALSEKGNILSPEVRMFLATGFCGGFTTFSTFSYEILQQLRDGEIFLASIYIFSSIIFGLLAAYAGFYLIKSL
ncbi:MAG: fluoride efflux transporter CrcB [Bacteroidales bacterium]